MQKKKIYIVVRSARASDYGIGTFQAQLIESLKSACVEYGIIELTSSADSLTVKQKDGYEYISVPIKNRGVNNPESVKYSYRNAVYLLRELIPDEKGCNLVFHINFTSDPTFVVLLKRFFKCKVVLTIHYTDWSFDLSGDKKKFDTLFAAKKRNLDIRERMIMESFETDIKMARRCDHVVYIARHSDRTLSKYIKAKNDSVIYNGLKDEYEPLADDAKRVAKMRHYINPDTKIIVFAGRLDDVKGVRFLIRSFRKVLTEHTNALLMIVGDGSFATLLKEAEDIWPKIIFTGRVEKKKLYELYSIADIGVVCSLYEEFGYVAVEMIMHGLPVIVSNTGGLAEIVEDGISGLKVPVVKRNGERQLNTKVLAEKINLLLDDEQLAERLSMGARARFLKEFELSIFSKNMISLYNNLIGSPESVQG